MRTRAFVAFLLGACALVAQEIPTDWQNPPLALVAAKVELTVGRELTLVSGRFMFQYLAGEDAGYHAHLYVHYPLYVEKGLTDWRELASASDIKLDVAGQTLRPVSGNVVSPELLSNFPIPEDAAVAFMTFEIPRAAATLRFEAVISHVQPNFHYRGALLAAYTPWQPKAIQTTKTYSFADNDFEVTFRGLEGVAFKKFTANDNLVRESPSKLVVVPSHRQTIAVQILPAEPAKAGAATGPAKP